MRIHSSKRGGNRKSRPLGAVNPAARALRAPGGPYSQRVLRNCRRYSRKVKHAGPPA